MKELSIEEKAKRYESALERCRKLYKEAKANEYISDIEDYETIFPELTESEDERIRKEIIEHIKWSEDNQECAKEEMIRWVAWLEKQGTSYTKRDVDDAYVEGMAFAKDELEKQGKKMPAWSEEEEKNFKKAIKVLKVSNFHHTADMLQEMKYKLIPREETNNWKPSDKQLEAIKRASKGSRAIAGNDYLILESLYNDLKKLKGE